MTSSSSCQILEIFFGVPNIRFPFALDSRCRLMNHLFYVSMIATGRVPTIPDSFYRVTYIAVLLAALLLANTLLSQSYAAVVTSFRQHPPTTPVIDTLAALERILQKEHSPIHVAVLDDTKYNAILNPREPTELMKLFKNHSTLCPTKPECVKLVQKRRHVLLASEYLGRIIRPLFILNCKIIRIMRESPIHGPRSIGPLNIRTTVYSSQNTGPQEFRKGKIRDNRTIPSVIEPKSVRNRE